MSDFSEVHSDMETDKRIKEDDEEMKRWEKDMYASYISGKVALREKVLELIQEKLDNTYSHDNAPLSLLDLMKEIKKL